ncbi:hypothetical protein [Bergeyella zoohelcum]|uniref:Uncharacterized protein n=1 Tax=Bergeyella zoohelcum TaxID=1015 RepID=A0A7Z8YMZ8_9FLAO|nr:hypothetical protein [Bergeyella zoohelcum]VDH03693.1 Uncharacterised protein [Bergeyella zoohelcum]
MKNSIFIVGAVVAGCTEQCIKDSIENDKDFMMQIHFTNEQLSQINSYLHQYKNKFNFVAHFIAVNDLEILRNRSNKRELLGGHSSQGKSIEKCFKQSFKNKNFKTLKSPLIYKNY